MKETMFPTTLSTTCGRIDGIIRVRARDIREASNKAVRLILELNAIWQKKGIPNNEELS